MNFRKTYCEFIGENFNFKALYEKEGDSYSKGCAMIFFNFPDQQGLHDLIDPAHLYTEEGDRSYGLENEAHITLLYGLNKEVTKDEVFDALKGFTVTEIKLKNVSAFKNEKFDVLKWDVEAPVLFDMNEELIKLPHENDFPNYHPHATIAYLKPVIADHYIKEMLALEYIVQPTHIVYSTAGGEKFQHDIANMPIKSSGNNTII